MVVGWPVSRVNARSSRSAACAMRSIVSVIRHPLPRRRAESGARRRGGSAGRGSEAARMKFVGVDLGGSHVMAAIVDEDGTIVHEAETDIEDHAFEAVVAAVGDTVEKALREYGQAKPRAIGIGSPGNIDPATGSDPLLAQLRLVQKYRSANALAKRLGTRVLVGNDARCATLGEHTFGTGQASPTS